jgi:imidazolonepropionase-like amidohydrolase
VVQLDAWNYEDAAYKMDNGLYINMPSLMPRRGGRMAFVRPGAGSDPIKAAMENIETIKTFFTDAKAYYQEKTHAANNLKLEAVRGLFDGKQKLFVRANEVKQILLAMDLAKSFGFKLVIVGGTEAYQIADLLAENNVPVILDRQHALPSMEDDDVDQPYKTPAALQKAGVLFCLNDTHDQSRFRNLAFNAGTAATYGLTKEQALSAVTLNAAKILGIDDKTGTIETGKDANLLIVNGDLLDMKSSVIGQAFIQGRNVSLDNKGKQLYERYKHKYQLK